MDQVVKRFKAPRKTMGELDADAAARLVAAAADVALVLDARGVIRDLALGSDELPQQEVERWLGQPWVDVVTIESKPKIEALLRDADSDAAVPRWRQVNHPSARGDDVPVLYSAVRLNHGSRTVAIGRSMRAIATLQQRLVRAQQTVEREYTRLMHAETRYRLLFRLASEAMMIVEATTMKVTEANPAAVELFASSAKRLIGTPFPQGFDARSVRALQELIIAVRSGVAASDVSARTEDGRTLRVFASLFQQDGAAHCLVRLSDATPQVRGAAQEPREQSRVLDVVESLPDAFVVTDLAGNVLTANQAFVDLTQSVKVAQVQGQSLDRWLGRPGVDLGVLISSLREHGSIRLFATTIRDATGGATEVELCGVAVPAGEQPCMGFTIRNVARRLNAAPGPVAELPRSPAQIAELIGKVPLKDLVRESTDVIERLCIEAALQLTGDNRASAAEMLGLSRQSLYAKLRRYGLGELDSTD